jgi:hypothetical protein
MAREFESLTFRRNQYRDVSRKMKEGEEFIDILDNEKYPPRSGIGERETNNP